MQAASSSIDVKTRTFVLLNSTFRKLGLSRSWQRVSSPYVFDSRGLAAIGSPDRRVFQIVGVARSGTTLLCRAVDLHARLVCFNEPFSDLYRFNEFTRFSDGRRFRSIPMDTIRRLAKAEDSELIGFKETFRDRAGVSHALISEGFVKSNDRSKACKTVAVLRDPRDVWCSLLDNNARLGLRRIPLSRSFTRTWLRMARWTREQELFYVRYEDLALDYEAELRRVVDFLGVAFDRNMLDRSANLATPAEGEAPTSGDPVALSDRPVSATSVGRFAADLDPRERFLIEDECGELMEAFGYSCR